MNKQKSTSYIDLTASDDEATPQSRPVHTLPKRPPYSYGPILPRSDPHIGQRGRMAHQQTPPSWPTHQQAPPSWPAPQHSIPIAAFTPSMNRRDRISTREHPPFSIPNRSNVAYPVEQHQHISRPPQPQSLPPLVKTQPTPRGRVCVECLEHPDVSCDGGQPCTACAEPGFDCRYPGEPSRRASERVLSPDPRAHLAQPKAVQAQGHTYVRNEQPRVNSAETSQTRLSTQHRTPDNEVLIPNTIPTPLSHEISNAVDGELSFEDDSYSDDSLPLVLDDLESVTKILQRYKSRMRAHREFLLQPLLSRAKLDTAEMPGPTLPEHLPNPFTSLIPLKSKQVANNPSKSNTTLQIQTKSHKPGALKKWTVLAIPITVVEKSATVLPKYKSIGRLGSNILAPNSEVLKYLPYFPDAEASSAADEKRGKEIAEYYHTDEKRVRLQRKCLERAQAWKQWAEEFVSYLEIQFRDVLWYILHQTGEANPDRHCRACRTSMQVEVCNALMGSSQLLEPDARSLSRAGMVVEAFKKVAEFSFWHVVVETSFVKEIMKQPERRATSPDTLCSICFLHHCISHGAFVEQDDSKDEEAASHHDGGKHDQSIALINNDEHDLNTRLMTTIRNKPKENVHHCGLYCVDVEIAIKAILGRRSDGSIGGVYNRATHTTRPAIDNEKPCGTTCFWLVQRRTRFSKVVQTKSFEPAISLESKKLFEKLLGLYNTNQRLPCMISAEIQDLSCLDAFYYVLATTQQPSHLAQSLLTLQDPGIRKPAKTAQAHDTTMSNELDYRPPFFPCSHEGPCHSNPDCSCSQDKVHCEPFCGCDKECKRRFQGCKCGGGNRTCFDDHRCECWVLNRECDPWLCGTCGAVEVLDPRNRYNEEIRAGRCKNTRIQLDLPARTIKAYSEVQGWGLFAGEDLEANAFLGEYKGERVSNQESDRRGSVYHHLGQEYLFTVNKDQQIDGSNFGNKMRFINNSQRDKYLNVMAKNLLCNGVQRVMLYTKRPVKAGDELLYKYNYPKEVTDRFWEPGEAPTIGSGTVVAKPSISTTNGRLAKLAGKQNDVLPSTSKPNPRARESSSKSNAKRKRMSGVDGSFIGATGSKSTDIADEESNVSDFEGDLAAADDEDSEVEEESSTSESSEEDDEAAKTVASRKPAKRRIHPGDGRFGGEAQRRAARTRREREQAAREAKQRQSKR